MKDIKPICMGTFAVLYVHRRQASHSPRFLANKQGPGQEQ